MTGECLLVSAQHPNILTLERAGKKRGSVKIDHDSVGGVFDSTSELLIVYGLAAKLDQRSPQSEILSIFVTKGKPRRLLRKTYGGGIYEVKVGYDPRFIFVASRFGFDIIDTRTMKIKSFDPLSEPDFQRQHCKADEAK